LAPDSQHEGSKMSLPTGVDMMCISIISCDIQVHMPR